MIRDRDAWIARIKSIEREALVMKLAAVRLGEQARIDATILTNGGLVAKDLKIALTNLDGTYLIRLFAEFEVALRSYWVTIKRTHPRAKDLLDGLTANRGVPPNLLISAHAVRKHRNRLVHERIADASAIPLTTARGVCCKFLSRLPERWG